MTDEKVRVRARIRFLSIEEGGRREPLHGGGSYRPNHNLSGPSGQDFCIGQIDLPEGMLVAPGDTIEAEITFFIYPKVKPLFKGLRQWRIQEGARLVAVGTLLEVLDQVGWMSD